VQRVPPCLYGKSSFFIEAVTSGQSLGYVVLRGLLFLLVVGAVHQLVTLCLMKCELVQNKRSHKSYFGAAAQQHTSSTAVTICHNVVRLGCLRFLESKKSPKMSHVKGAGCIWLPCFRSTGNKQAAGKALHHSSQSDRSTLQKHTACASHRSAQRATPSTENSQVHT